MILENIVEDDQLEAAINEAGVSHKTLERLAVDSGFITSQNAIDLNQEQLKRDMPFGKLAKEKGLLTEEQLVELVKTQVPSILKWAKHCSKLGYVSEAELEDVLEGRYQAAKSGQSNVLASSGTFRPSRGRFCGQFFSRNDHAFSKNSYQDWGTYFSGRRKFKGFYRFDLHERRRECFAHWFKRGIKILANEVIRGMTRIMSGDEDIQFGQEKGDYEDLLGASWIFLPVMPLQVLNRKVFALKWEHLILAFLTLKVTLLQLVQRPATLSSFFARTRFLA